MAVIVDVEALLAEAGPEASRLGREHLAQGRVTGLTAVDGGARATVVNESGGRSNVSVTIIGRTLVDDCDRDGRPGEGLCEHAVALVMAALDAGITWTASPDDAGDSDERDLLHADAATDLTRTELVRLVVEHARDDRMFAAKLLQRAGRLTEAGPAELEAARDMIQEAAAIPDGKREWDLYDLVKAGYAIADELELLAVRPANAELLDVVEEALMVWNELAGYLYDAWETFETEPSEIGERLADIHLELCEELRPDPVQLAQRLAELVDSAPNESHLDAPEGYADILGDEGLDAYYVAMSG